MIGLTDRQREVLSLVVHLGKALGAPPTSAEIAAHLGISRTAVDQHISALCRKGRLSREPGRSRNIRVLDDSEVTR